MDFRVCSAQSASPTHSHSENTLHSCFSNSLWRKMSLLLFYASICQCFYLKKKVTRKSKRYHIKARVYLCLLLDSTDLKIPLSNSYKFSAYVEFRHWLSYRPVTMYRLELVLRLRWVELIHRALVRHLPVPEHLPWLGQPASRGNPYHCQTALMTRDQSLLLCVHWPGFHTWPTLNKMSWFSCVFRYTRITALWPHYDFSPGHTYLSLQCRLSPAFMISATEGRKLPPRKLPPHWLASWPPVSDSSRRARKRDWMMVQDANIAWPDLQRTWALIVEFRGKHAEDTTVWLSPLMQIEHKRVMCCLISQGPSEWCSVVFH